MSCHGALLTLCTVGGMALAGCGADLAPPRILEVSPTSMLASDAPELTVQLDGVLPFEIDYGSAQAVVDTDVSVRIGDEPLGTAPYLNEGQVRIRVPSVFSPGSHPVTVSFSDGRSAIAEAPFEVSPGDWPTSYTLSAIDAQRVGVPFDVRIEAIRAGLPMATFRGTVELSVQDGTTLRPSRSPPFTGGQITVRMVTVSAPGSHAVVVRDANGTSAVSNTFPVVP